MSDKISLGNHATSLIEKVLTRVETAVTSTMGPDGQVALIGSGQSSWTTKDGVTVARALQFETDEEEIINRIISEPAIKTDDECGDGTTTTIKLTAVIYRLLRKDPSFKGRKRVERIVNMLIAALKDQTVFLGLNDEKLYKVALTTANQDHDLATQVMSIYRSAEKGYPDVEIKPGRGATDEIERIEGRVINMYFADQWFAGNNNSNQVKLGRYIPVIVDDRILRASPQDFFDGIANIRNQVEQQPQPTPESPLPIVLVVRSIEKDPINMLANILTNDPRMKQYNTGGLPGVIVAMTNLGGGLGAAEMQDIASILGAPYVNGIEALKTAQVTISQTPLTIGVSRSSIHDLTPDDVARIDVRIQAIEQEIAGYSYSDRFTTRARINERRIRRLRGEVVTILVGGETNQEIKERVDRYQDVVKAVRSALENGVLPGCGMGLINAARAVDLQLVHWVDREIVQVIGTSIWWHLMKDHAKEHEPEPVEIKQSWFAGLFGKIYHIEPIREDNPINSRFPIINIATGETMDVTDMENLAVWDTAFATITALKGGFQTAQILATASSVFNTVKLHGRTTNVGP